VLLLWAWGCAGAGGDSGVAADSGGVDWSAVEAAAADHAPLPALPADPTNRVADEPGAAWLGRWLFFDARLSGSGEFSCASCHDPSLGFGDGRALSVATGTTARHAQTVLNSAHNSWFFWDGRADTQWMQALGPLEDRNEQATSRLAIAHLVDEDEELRAAYEGVFGELPDFGDQDRFPAEGRPVPGAPDDPLDVAWSGMEAADQVLVETVFANVGKAIAAYERQLVRGDSTFDRWASAVAAGEADAQGSSGMSDAALEGFSLFLGEGNCHFCHAGPLFTNREFHNIGLAPAEGTALDDLGRYDGIARLLADPFNGAGAYSDDPATGALDLDHLALGDEQFGQFKTPSLRNVAETAPYMHGGQFQTLTDVVRYYSLLDQEPLWGHREDLMQPLEWSDAQIAAVVAFLESLSGAPLDAELLGPPASPIGP
jgi:cytochrome c peroxidase